MYGGEIKTITSPNEKHYSNSADGDYSTNGCWLTEAYANSWWMVDIGGPHRVQSVVITNRDNYGNVAGQQNKTWFSRKNTGLIEHRSTKL